MTRDDIIKILEWHPSHVEHGKEGLLSRIERVVEIAVAAEREACAKVCDHMASRCSDIRSAALEMAAENIRARGRT